MYVDLSTWTDAERTNMRISIRPNTSANLPTGPFPKNIWFDDISMIPLVALAELKDIAIEVAEERMQLALDAGFVAEANTLTSEITALRNSTPASALVPQNAVGFNPPLLHTTDATNPFVASLNAWGASFLASSFMGFPKATTSNFVFPKAAFSVSRSLSTNMERMYWLLVSPQSSYKNHPELFRRFLTSLYATSDDYLLNGTEQQNNSPGVIADGVPGSTDNALNDWFASPMVAYGWRMAEFSFPDYIPNSLKIKMEGLSLFLVGVL